jgi:DNA-binding SARP family transcriptional activator
VADGRAFVPPRARTRGLLSLLTLNVGRRLSPDAIGEALWSGTEPASARSQIQTAVYGIRRVLADAGATSRIEGGMSGYRLVPYDDRIDLAAFEHHLATAQAAREAGTIDDAVTALHSALELWEDTPLADASGAFVESARAMLIDRRLGAVEELADIELARGADAALVPQLAQHVAAHPLRESLRSRYVMALHYGGRTTEALRNLREYRDLLVENYGLDPGARLAELEGAILRNHLAPSHEQIPHIPQMRRPPVDRPAVTAAVPAQLPMALTDFIGRVEEMERLDAAAQRPGAIVTIAGTPCVGKTALAVFWAHRLRSRYPDGQLYVNLRGYSSEPPLAAYEVLSNFLTAYGLAPRDLPPDVESAAALFRSIVADRRVLILLDNALSPEHVRPLLVGGAGCLTVVTSRDRLAGLIVRDGARSMDVGPLSPEESTRLITDILGRRRVDAERSAAVELGELCVRLPLALRIAATRLANEPRVSIASTVVRVRENPLRELAVPGDPQTAIVATFNLSYAHLSPAARRLFRLIGVAPCATVTGAAAAELLGSDRGTAEKLLAGLTAASLLDRRDDNRYAMHDLLRVYACERSDQEDAPALRFAALQRLYDHWLAHLDAAARQLYPHVPRLPRAPKLPTPKSPVSKGDIADIALKSDIDLKDGVDWTMAEAIGWIDSELPSLRRAAANLADTDPQRAWLIADSLRGYFGMGHGTVHWSDIAGSGLRAAEVLQDERAQIMCALNAGEERAFHGDHDAAALLLQRALDQAEAIDWLEGQEAVHRSLGPQAAFTHR